MKKADKENERFSDGDSGGSVGTDSGSASGSGGNGSDRGIDGSSRSANGNDRGIDGSGNGNDGSADFGSNGSDNSSESIGTNDANVESVSDDRNSIDNGNNGKRRRIGKPIRLGNFRDRDSDASADGNDGNDGNENGARRDNSEPVVRLGAKSKERPRSDVKDDNAETIFEIGKTKDLIKVFINSVFEIPAISLKQDFWRLSKDESTALTDALMEYLKSMPKAKASKLAQFLKENLPLVNLAMIAFFIVSERVKSSMAISAVTKAGQTFEKQARAATNVTPNNNIVTPLDFVHNTVN